MPEHDSGLGTRASRLPEYSGGSLPNLTATISRLLGAAGPDETTELTAGLVPAELLAGVNIVVVLMVDGLGISQLRRLIAAGEVPTLAGLVQDAEGGKRNVSFATLTSVFPSATMSALASFHTALAPASHGVTGWTAYLEEFGQVVEIARLGPAAGRGSFTEPELGGVDPIAFFGFETIYRKLELAGVPSVAVGPGELDGSAFSVAALDGAEYWPYVAPSSTFVLIERALRQWAKGQRFLVYAYWSVLDSLTHRAGPEGEEHASEAAVLDFLLGRWLARAACDGDLLFLLTADHGHLATDPALTLRLDQHPDLLKELIAPPSGERRLGYLHVRPGRTAAVQDYVRGTFPGQAALMPSAEAFGRGLFGPGRPSPLAVRRAGDFLLFPLGNHQLVYPHDPNRPVTPFYGNHGALSPEEMEVPLLALRL